MATVASLLAGHVRFRCTSVDRIGVAGYIPGLAYEGGVIRFLLQRGYPIPSPAGLGHNTTAWSPSSTPSWPRPAWRWSALGAESERKTSPIGGRPRDFHREGPRLLTSTSRAPRGA
jgi:hypothetical protein